MYAMDKVVWVGDDEDDAGIWKVLRPDLTLTLKRLQSLLLLAIEYKAPNCTVTAANIDRWVLFRLMDGRAVGLPGASSLAPLPRLHVCDRLPPSLNEALWSRLCSFHAMSVLGSGVVLMLGEIAMARLWIMSQSVSAQSGSPGDLSRVVVPTFFIHGRAVDAYFFYFQGTDACHDSPALRHRANLRVNVLSRCLCL